MIALYLLNSHIVFSKKSRTSARNPRELYTQLVPVFPGDWVEVFDLDLDISSWPGTFVAFVCRASAAFSGPMEGHPLAGFIQTADASCYVASSYILLHSLDRRTRFIYNTYSVVGRWRCIKRSRGSRSQRTGAGTSLIVVGVALTGRYREGPSCGRQTPSASVRRGLMFCIRYPIQDLDSMHVLVRHQAEARTLLIASLPVGCPP